MTAKQPTARAPWNNSYDDGGPYNEPKLEPKIEPTPMAHVTFEIITYETTAIPVSKEGMSLGAMIDDMVKEATLENKRTKSLKIELPEEMWLDNRSNSVSNNGLR